MLKKTMFAVICAVALCANGAVQAKTAAKNNHAPFLFHGEFAPRVEA